MTRHAQSQHCNASFVTGQPHYQHPSSKSIDLHETAPHRDPPEDPYSHRHRRSLYRLFFSSGCSYIDTRGRPQRGRNPAVREVKVGLLPSIYYYSPRSYTRRITSILAPFSALIIAILAINESHNSMRSPCEFGSLLSAVAISLNIPSGVTVRRTHGNETGQPCYSYLPVHCMRFAWFECGE